MYTQVYIHICIRQWMLQHAVYFKDTLLLKGADRLFSVSECIVFYLTTVMIIILIM